MIERNTRKLTKVKSNLPKKILCNLTSNNRLFSQMHQSFRRAPPPRKRLPQVPHLVKNPIGSQSSIQPTQHHFTVDNSNSNLLSNKYQGVQPHLPHVQPPTIDSMEQGTRQRPQPTMKKSSSKQDLPKYAFNPDDQIDKFLSIAATEQLPTAIQIYLKDYFEAKDAVIWIDVQDIQTLYCPTYDLVTSHSSGLIGYSFFSRTVIRTPNPTGHPSFNSPVDGKLCQSNTPVLIFPLFDNRNNICAIVEVVKNCNANEFSPADEEFASWFGNKYKLLNRWLKPESQLDALTLEVMQLMKQDLYLPHLSDKISSHFECRAFDIWKMEKDTKKVTKYTDKKESVELLQAGIAGDALQREIIINIVNSKLHSNYNQTADGTQEEAVLAVPVIEADNNIIYILVLRGPKKRIFTKDDERALKKAGPMILLGLSNSEEFSNVEIGYSDSQKEREGLAALLEVVEVLSSQLEVDKLPEIIMDKGRELTDSDRCSLFLVNEARDRLITSFHKGLENAIDIPIDKGIAGKTVTEKQVYNISDVYETDFFDSSTDRESGYRTRSILSVPIFNNRGEIIGVTEMVNKLNNEPFTAWDTKLIQIFNVFCGISLENARLFKESLDMSAQLRSFFEVSFSMNKSESLQRQLSDIMHNAKQSINADRSSLFICEEGDKNFSTFIADGDKMPPTLPVTNGVIGACASSKKGIIVNNAYEDPQFNRSVDNITGYKTKSLLASPIMSSTGKLIGVVEMINKKTGEFSQKDLQLITAFSTFASIALENSRLKDMAELGDVDIEMHKWITESERTGTDIPKALELSQDEQSRVLTRDCMALDFKGIGHFKELFYFFNKFGFLKEYNIVSEKFFRFIFTISSTYTQTYYHNWTHACDVTQYLVYEIEIAGLANIFNKFELFGLLTSAICHDANHEGFNNVYNVKAETPFGILFKDQSVMEMHHITVAIPILTQENINLFHALSPEDTKRMWNLFISLILATDMAHHFEIVKSATGLLDENKFDLNEPDNRLLAMKMILKIADISNVSRPFPLADKWCDILCDEFFHQGDLEKETGIGLTSPLNDREHQDKPKSQIGFYNFICLPLYQVAARLFPELQANVDAVKSNLETWKSMIPPAPAAS